MGLFKRKPKKVVETPEQKMEDLRKQLTTLNQKSFQIKRMTSVYDQQIEKNLANIKQNPKNEFLIGTTKNTLKYLVAKKKAYQKFGAIIEAVKAQVETKYTEISLTRGEEVIDSKFCDEISKIYSTCEEYTDMIDKTSSIDQLEIVMKNFTDSLGIAMGFNTDDEVDSLINEAISPKKEESKAEVKKEEKKDATDGEVDIEKLLDKIRKSM